MVAPPRSTTVRSSATSSASTWRSSCPYNLARTWHVQLAIFWVSTSFLAAGIFLAPMIAGREPPRQHWLAYGLLAALVIVVVGSLTATPSASTAGAATAGRCFGNQGFEYLDLGRFWQILLSVGLFFWVAIIFRALPRPPAARAAAATCPGCSSSPRWRSPRSTPWDCSPAPSQFHHHRLLALLGGASLGRGLPGAVHDDHGRVHLRAARRGGGARGTDGRLLSTSCCTRSAV